MIQFECSATCRSGPLLSRFDARLRDKCREGHFPQQNVCRNSMQKSASSWVIVGKFFDGSAIGHMSLQKMHADTKDMRSNTLRCMKQGKSRTEAGGSRGTMRF